MSKTKTMYVCQSCGASFGKWQGRCDNCGEWNALAEQIVINTTNKGDGARHNNSNSEFKNIDLSSFLVSFDQKLKNTEHARFSTTLSEFDRVLGMDSQGIGMVSGAVVLVGGEPGIGKSTLLTQVVIGMGQSLKKGKIVYVCGEESPGQISLRLRRMMGAELQPEEINLDFITSTNVDEIVELVRRGEPRILIVDSVQTLTTRDLAGPAGSLGQVKECTERIVNCVKERGVPTFLVGHVTKEGTIAGPKTLEHMVDAILELSGERGGDLRFLRAVKNRFGATDEVGVFQLIEGGIREVSNPSHLFLEQIEASVPGSAVICAMEGTRPILTEVQALVVESQLAMPRRVGRGVDLSRIQVLCAILQKHLKMPVGMNDVFLSVAGGLQVREPAVELGLAMAIASSFFAIPLPSTAVFVGEVGLMGEIRSVSNLERRIKEAKRLGYEKIYSRQTHRKLGDLLRELKMMK